MTRSNHTKEARRGARFRHDSVLELTDGSGSLLSEAARIVDVSSVGVSFTTTHVLARGERVRARMRLLGIGVLEIEGRVVRIKENSNSTLYAVEFDSVRENRRRTL